MSVFLQPAAKVNLTSACAIKMRPEVNYEEKRFHEPNRK